MYKLIFELESDDSDFDGAPAGALEGFPELSQARKYWLENIFRQYRKARGNRSNDNEWLQIKYEIMPGDVGVFQFEFNEGLFDQLVAAYSQFGWSIIETISKHIGQSRWRLTKVGQELFQATRLLLLRSIAKALIAFERNISAYANEKWSTSIDSLSFLQTKFSMVTASKYRISDETISKQLYGQFVEYNKLMLKIESSIRRRKSVYRSNAYVPGKNDMDHMDLYRAFGAAELTSKNAMAKIATDIKELFPAAVFVLDDCFDILRKDIPELYKRRDLETHIHLKLEEAGHGLMRLRKGLRRDGLAARMSSQLSGENGGLEESIAEFAMSSWKMAGTIENAATNAAALFLGMWHLLPESGQNPVMGLPGLVREYWGELVEANPASWDRVISEHYLHALEERLRKQEQDEKDFEAVLKVIRIVEAAIAIVAFIALVVVTDGAAMPAGIALFAARLKATNTALGLLVLVTSVAELKLADDRFAEEAEQLLATLSAQDADTLAAVGSALSRFHLFRYELTLELAKMLIQQRLAGKLKVIEKALDLEGLAFDIETMMSLPASSIAVDDEMTVVTA